MVNIKLSSEKYFNRIMMICFVVVFLFSYSYRLGGWFYDIIPGIFLGGVIISIGSVVGVLMYPLAQIYQTFFYYKFAFLPVAFTTFYGGVVIALLIIILVLKKERIKNDVNLILIIVLGFAALLSTITNGYNIGFGNYEFTHYIESILIFFIVGTFVSTKRKLRLFSWMILFAVAAIVFRLYTHSYSYDIAIAGFENNYLARILAFYIPFLLGMFWAEKDKYLKFLVMVVLAFTVQGVTQLGSRATYLALGVTMPFMLIKNFKKKSTWAFIGLGIIFLMFFTTPLLIEDIKTIPLALQGTEAEEGSIQGRADIAVKGWETFKERPLLGYGVYPAIFENLMLKRYDIFRSGHNAFIIIAVEMGIFGILSYVGLFAASIFYCFKAHLIAREKDPFISNIAQGTGFGLMALGINQFMLNNPWIPTAFIGFGISTSLYYLAKTGRKGKYHIPKYLIPLIIFSSVASVLVLVFYIFVRMMLG